MIRYGPHVTSARDVVTHAQHLRGGSHPRAPDFVPPPVARRFRVCRF